MAPHIRVVLESVPSAIEENRNAFHVMAFDYTGRNTTHHSRVLAETLQCKTPHIPPMTSTIAIAAFTPQALESFQDKHL
ncbi:MAG: hypothetical protein E5Y69_10905 [Mesorhizobium sp.]|nr:MAG: hypothetical protein E5Y69_10905 [Mesorhizobium sp.]